MGIQTRARVRLSSVSSEPSQLADSDAGARLPERFLPGTDFVAARKKTCEVYAEEIDVTSKIHLALSDGAFRNIALGQNYFRLLGLDHQAPEVCRNQQVSG